DGAPPPVDLAAERRNGDFVRHLIRTGALRCVHDLSDGGLAIAAAEMALASGLGLTLDATSRARAHVLLFCEDQARYLVATDAPEAVVAAALQAGVNVAPVGLAGGDAFASTGLFSLPLAALREAHEGWMPRYMGET
ncbi:MAG TPA: AIR synthase-related protein, partial [Pseudolabrys sp.]|nr:AIR synthase-related protein [Pseudolabrys sp.]